jgi:hypothetical protein
MTGPDRQAASGASGAGSLRGSVTAPALTVPTGGGAR